MKSELLSVVFFAVSLTTSAQEYIQVNFEGANPTISDFVWALLSEKVDDSDDGEEMMDESAVAFMQAWSQYRKGLPLDDGETITCDQKNGYVAFESRSEENLLKIEMCFWNEADGKHKLIAYNVASYYEGNFNAGTFDGITYYRYDNSAKKMAFCDDTDLPREMMDDDGSMISYSLPIADKDIIAKYWNDEGEKKQKVLKWNGHKFD